MRLENEFCKVCRQSVPRRDGFDFPSVCDWALCCVADGHSAVLLNVLRQPDANTLNVTDEVKAELADIQKTLSNDIKIAPFYDQSILVRASMNSGRRRFRPVLMTSLAAILGMLPLVSRSVRARNCFSLWQSPSLAVWSSRFCFRLLLHRRFTRCSNLIHKIFAYETHEIYEKQLKN